MLSRTFERFAGECAIVAGIGGFLYGIAFIFLYVRGLAPNLGALLSGLLLMIGALLAIAAYTALYGRLREIEPPFALLAFVLGVAGQAGAALHGGYDLANTINPPVGAVASLPSEVDPRGLSTFFLVALSLFIVAWLLGRDRYFPASLRYVAALSAVLSVILYLGRLILLDPNNPVILIAALLAGFIVNPVWYIWLGLTFLRGGSQQKVA
jgi:hypothetical protein